MKSLDIVNDCFLKPGSGSKSQSLRALQKAQHPPPNRLENERMDGSHNERYIEAEHDSAERTLEGSMIGIFFKLRNRGGKVSAGHT